MGHEIAHALREHSREQISQQMGTQAAIGIVGALLGIGDLGQSLGELVADVTLNMPNSRTARNGGRPHRRRARRARGLRPARRDHACGRRWEGSSGGQPPNFLSTHPSHENRIADLRAYAAAGDAALPGCERQAARR